MTTSVAEAFQELPHRYNAHMGIGLNATYQWNITGEGAGQWHVVLNDGEISVHEGPAEKPDVVITVAGPVWLEILSGELDHLLAYASGKLRIAGPMPLARKIGTLFLSPQHH